VKKFIKEIIYSKEEIQVNIYYLDPSTPSIVLRTNLLRAGFADDEEANEGRVSRQTAEGCKGAKAPYRQSV